jgi:hypothetical protein
MEDIAYIASDKFTRLLFWGLTGFGVHVSSPHIFVVDLIGSTRKLLFVWARAGQYSLPSGPILSGLSRTIDTLFLIVLFNGQADGNILYSNVSDIETKAERSFDLGFVFDIEAKRTCLFQNL